MEGPFLLGAELTLKMFAFLAGSVAVYIPVAIVASAVAKVIRIARRQHDRP